MSTFKTRPIARTGVNVTELSLGSAALAGNGAGVPDQQGRDTVATGLDAGINYIDTAPQYGLGRAEHLVGDALRDRRAGVVLSTKVGRLLKPFSGARGPSNWVNPFPFEQVYDYSYDGLMRAYEDSRQRLAIAEIDILYVHDIGVMTHGAERHAVLWKQFVDGGVRAMQELKASGAVKAIGLGVNEFQVLEDALELSDWDVFLLAGRYTLLEQTSLAFLETCIGRGVSVVAGAPFNGGALMGSGTWNYTAAPPEITARVKALENFCRDHNVPIGAAALQFALTHPAVATVLVGPKSPAEATGLVDWWNVRIPSSFWRDLVAAGLVDAATPLPV